MNLSDTKPATIFMRQNMTFLAVKMTLILILMFGLNEADAQIKLHGGLKSNEDSRIVMVVPDNYPDEVGSLNRTIEEEVVIDPNTIFVLQRDAVYWLDNTITNEDFLLHIRAEEGDGHPPIIRPTSIGGSPNHLFYTYDDAILDGLFLVAIDEEGVATRPLGLHGTNTTLIFDNGWVIGTHDWSVSFFDRNNSVFITNSVFANAGRPDHPDQGRFLETRAIDQDTIWVENTTMYNFKHAFLRNGGLIKYLHLNHVTGVNVANNIRPNRTIDATITNNLFLNFMANGVDDEDTITGIISGSAIGLAPVSDPERTFIIRNNNIGHMDEEHLEVFTYVRWKAYKAPVLNNVINSWKTTENSPTLIFEDNFEEGIDFDNPPSSLVPWTMGRWFDIDRMMAYDHWEEAGATTEPAAYHYTLDMIRNFAYSIDHTSYTAAERGYPVGDLNWFPDLKEKWDQDEIITNIDSDQYLLANNFRLVGNYPNPFNPTTNIVYELDSRVEVIIEVFNILGQKIETMDLGSRSAGRYEINFNAGYLSSGIYIVRMQAGNEIHTLRMSLVK